MNIAVVQHKLVGERAQLGHGIVVGEAQRFARRVAGCGHHRAIHQQRMQRRVRQQHANIAQARGDAGEFHARRRDNDGSRRGGK